MLTTTEKVPPKPVEEVLKKKDLEVVLDMIKGQVNEKKSKFFKFIKHNAYSFIYEQLNLIEEKKLSTLCHGHFYQKRMCKPITRKFGPNNSKKVI